MMVRPGDSLYQLQTLGEAVLSLCIIACTNHGRPFSDRSVRTPTA